MKLKPSQWSPYGAWLELVEVDGLFMGERGIEAKHFAAAGLEYAEEIEAKVGIVMDDSVFERLRGMPRFDQRNFVPVLFEENIFYLHYTNIARVSQGDCK